MQKASAPWVVRKHPETFSEEIGCSRLLDPPAPASFALRLRVEPFACGEDRRPNK